MVLGTTAMPVHQVLRLGRGAIIELDASEDDEVSILANNLPVAKGTVVVNGNRIAVEVKRAAAAPARHALSGRAQALMSPENRALRGVLGPCPAGPICYIDRRLRTRAVRPSSYPHAVVAELVDALA